MHAPIFPFTAIVGQDLMRKALVLNAVDPSIGGVLIRGEKGTAKTTAVRGIAAVLPPRRAVIGCPFSCVPGQKEGLCPECQGRQARGDALALAEGATPVVDLPLNASEDRVVGAIDIEAAIREGKKVFQPGILARAHRAILYVDEVNLLDDHIVDVLLDVAVTGVNVVEREGVTYAHPSRFLLVGTMNPEEGDLRPQLLDRFGVCVEVEAEGAMEARAEIVRRALGFQQDPEGFAARWAPEQEELRKGIEQARALVPTLSPSPSLVEFAASAATEMGVDGHRAEITLIKAALASAALHGRQEPDEADLRDALPLAFRHRTKRMPLQTGKPDPSAFDRLLSKFSRWGHL